MFLQIKESKDTTGISVITEDSNDNSVIFSYAGN